MKLTLWLAEQCSDSSSYNILARTKKDCLAQMATRDEKWEGPTKVVIEYHDAFDLFEWATSEMGGRHRHY
jgi:hypothetical protein